MPKKLQKLLDDAEQYFRDGNESVAERICRDVLKRNSANSEAHYLLGNILMKKGAFAEAEQSFTRAMGENPKSSVLYNNLGLAQKGTGQLDKARASFERAIALNPDYARAYFNLGGLLQLKGETEMAMEALFKANDLNPDNIEALYRIGSILHQNTDFFGALEVCDKILTTHPDLPVVINNKGNNYKYLGETDKSLACYSQAMELCPTIQDPFSNFLMTIHNSAQFSPVAVYAEHRRWAELQADGLAALCQPHANQADPQRRLRVGYVSRDFKMHPVAFFIEPILAHHDLTQLEVYCYADVDGPDSVTEQFRKFPVVWRDIHGLSDEEADCLIRADRIDVLVDLAGHTAYNRLLLFARKPAPVQVTWLGYAATTGLKTIDYRITDEFADPVGMTERYHSEQLYRLPGPFICYRPAANVPEVAPSPLAASGVCTFAIFNHFSKVTPEAIGCFAAILHGVPGSRLMIKSLGLDYERMKQHIREMFAPHGIGAERLELIGKTRTTMEHLELFGRVDISLDTFPYNGTTTTCESLWMGVPVIALEGDSHISRVGLSLLNHVRLPQFIARDREEYVRLAVALAANQELLVALRQSLRSILRNSPLLDAQYVARTLEDAYRQMWRQWCSTRVGGAQKI